MRRVDQFRLAVAAFGMFKDNAPEMAIETMCKVGPEVIPLIDAATELVGAFCDRVDQGEVLHTEEIRLMRAVARLEVDEVDE